MWIRIGAVLGFLAVASGAFGAHALRERVDTASLEVWSTAAHYHLLHALAIVAAGVLHLIRPSRALDVAAAAFVVGVLIFSGSLYALVLSGVRTLGMITPIGGVALLVGWAALAIGGAGSAAAHRGRSAP